MSNLEPSLADQLRDFLRGAVFSDGDLRSMLSVEDANDKDGFVLERLLRRVERLEEQFRSLGWLLPK